MSALASKIAKILADIEALELPAYVERISIARDGELIVAHSDVVYAGVRRWVSRSNVIAANASDLAATFRDEIEAARAELADLSRAADAEFGSHFSQVAA